MRSWLNYFHIEGVSYTSLPKRKLNGYLREYRQQDFSILVEQYGMIDPMKYQPVAVL